MRLAGFEPTTPWFVAKYSIQLSYSRKFFCLQNNHSSFFGAAGRIRTHDPLVRSQVLYPTELQPPKKQDYSIGFIKSSINVPRIDRFLVGGRRIGQGSLLPKALGVFAAQLLLGQAGQRNVGLAAARRLQLNIGGC